MSKASEYYLSGGVSGRLRQFEIHANSNTSAGGVKFHRGMLCQFLYCTLARYVASGRCIAIIMLIVSLKSWLRSDLYWANCKLLN
jgi:hypothetical protein